MNFPFLNKLFFSGTLRGSVYVHRCRRSLRIVKKLTLSTLCVNTLQISANRMYFAASDNGGNVFVWNFQTFETVFQWEEKEICKTLIAWHPWKESYLIVGKLIWQNYTSFEWVSCDLMHCQGVQKCETFCFKFQSTKYSSETPLKTYNIHSNEIASEYMPNRCKNQNDDRLLQSNRFAMSLRFYFIQSEIRWACSRRYNIRG